MTLLTLVGEAGKPYSPSLDSFVAYHRHPGEVEERIHRHRAGQEGAGLESHHHLRAEEAVQIHRRPLLLVVEAVRIRRPLVALAEEAL